MGVFYAIGVFIAAILIVSSVIAILVKVGNILGFFSLSLFILTLAFGVLFLESIFPEASNIPLLQLLLQCKTLVFLLLVFCFIFLAIQNMLLARSENTKPCNYTAAIYEPFVSESSETQLLQRIRKANWILEQLQTSSDDLNQISSDTCALLKETEQNFIDANTRPGLQSPEYNACVSSKRNEEECKDLKLPPERQKAQDERQRSLAQKKYSTERQQFRGTLECFQNGDKNFETEEDLRNILADIQFYLEPTEEAKLRKTCRQIQTSMAFVLHLTRQGNAEMEKAKNQSEGFQTEKSESIQILTGNVLIQEADAMFSKAGALVSLISKTKSEFVKAKSEYETLRGKITRMAAGEPTQSDIVQVPKPQQGSCPTYMFEYGTDAGGYCCADFPTEYSFDRSTYVSCPSSSAVTEDLKKQRRKRFNEAMNSCGESDLTCISQVNSTFQNTLRKQPTCRHSDNPKTDVPVCSYICPKTGKTCSYVEFKAT